MSDSDLPTGQGIGFSLLTFTDATLDELVELAQLGERLGYERVYTTESLTDTLSIDLAIAARTERIVVGSSVALAPLRHPVIAAEAAATISELSGGRFILGLGLGHEIRNRAFGLSTGPPAKYLREYVEAVRAVLGGQGRAYYSALPPQSYQGVGLDFRRTRFEVPIYTAAVGPRMTALAGAIADGMLIYLVPRGGLARARSTMEAGAVEAGRDPSAVELNVGVHVFCSEDEALARDKARGSLAYWVGLGAYNDSLRRSGFAEEADEIRAAFTRGDREALHAAITDAVIDEFCVVGSPAQCHEALQTFKRAGVDFLSITPNPVEPGESYTVAVRRTLEQLARAA
jgi:alkanesulfonate monooxygenase SsuD/methylene tetrahydromethanopterin reductase-like flavin-dependent oxidoreductase (luciferase family)